MGYKLANVVRKYITFEQCLQVILGFSSLPWVIGHLTKHFHNLDTAVEVLKEKLINFLFLSFNAMNIP